MLSLHTSLVKMLRSVVYNTTSFPPSIYGCIRTGVVGYRGYSSKWLAEMAPRDPDAKVYVGHKVCGCADRISERLLHAVAVGVVQRGSISQKACPDHARLTKPARWRGRWVRCFRPSALLCGCCIAEIGAFPLHLRNAASASAFISTSCMPYSSSLYPAEMTNTRFAPTTERELEHRNVI